MSRAWYQVAFGAHYPRLYAHRDAAEAARAVAALRRLAPLGEGPVLDLGCGAGRHLPALAACAAPVIGLDLSAALLELAAAAVPAAAAVRLLRADMRALPLRDGCATAVTSLFTTFGYFGDLDAHAPLLAEIARALAPGGHWFLDYLDAEATRRELAAGEIATSRQVDADLSARECRRLEGGRVVKRVQVRPQPGRESAAARLGVPAGGLAYREEVALFTLAQLDALAESCGLRRVAAVGGYDGQALGAPDADRWLLAFRRRGAAGAERRRGAA